MKFKSIINNLLAAIYSCLSTPIFFGRHVSRVPGGSIVLFPCRVSRLSCGLAGIVAFKRKETPAVRLEWDAVVRLVDRIKANGHALCRENGLALKDFYLGGGTVLDSLLGAVRQFKAQGPFYQIYSSPAIQKDLKELSEELDGVIAAEKSFLAQQMGRLDAAELDAVSSGIEKLMDIRWCLSEEILENVVRIEDLVSQNSEQPTPAALKIYKEINAVLNSIDRLEVRGRDSAGLSLILTLAGDEYRRLRGRLESRDLYEELLRRSRQNVLVDQGVSLREGDDGRVSITLTYKVAAEIGRLGDNIRFLRSRVRTDAVLQELLGAACLRHTVLSHTRWASVGAITEANCHPLDNQAGGALPQGGSIHVCLNGDIDNYRELKAAIEAGGKRIHADITTDTKIIPLQIEHYVESGFPLAESFRRAVNDFEGSHAIAMHSDLSPGKVFLAQKGSGQAIFVGLAPDHFMPASEVYGFIEETPDYIKMDGEKTVEGPNGPARGQIFILSQESGGGLEGIEALHYDGTPLMLTQADIKHTQITTRDIDRQGFSHYFLKEILESPESAAKTLLGRWKWGGAEDRPYEIALDRKCFPDSLRAALAQNRIRRIFFIGQGTAGVAALVCSNIFHYYLNDPLFLVSALKSSEFSGFRLREDDGPGVMSDALVIAITQSGTTTDTNRAVDMVRERGAYTLAIVNRRDSDITFKVDGVMYTSSGRDIEMSVASTKAFYSQIVAGALLGLQVARIKGCRDEQFVSAEIRALLELPDAMREVLRSREVFERSARKLAVAKTYWAAVGSGPNKAAADEIRIKLSELCYKTISSDYIEDKKHIDLSSEPLIIICAAGSRGTVIGDIVKDTAIFQAHKATPVVIADKSENRFDPFAADVFHVPIVSPHLAPVLNTLVGHLWGYYAALAINEGSEFLYRFREDVKNSLDAYAEKGLDIYEVVLENTFREKIAQFYSEFKKLKDIGRFHTALGIEAASDLILLLKYLSGRLPASDFELDFGKKGTAANMLAALFECAGAAVNNMARPVDAIKHQAKTVTVGTSRISDKVEGILFDALTAYGFNVSHLTNHNILVLKNLQGVVGRINGAILYHISGLNLLGELTDGAGIEIVEKTGILATLPSRVETDHSLKGTKRIIVRQGNVYIGKGRKDDRSIIVIPVISTAPGSGGVIEHLLLLNISFKEVIPLPVKIKALGGKYEHIKNIVQENSVPWNDAYLDLVGTENIFGFSAEKIGEFIVAKVNEDKG